MLHVPINTLPPSINRNEKLGSITEDHHWNVGTLLKISQGHALGLEEAKLSYLQFISQLKSF